MASGLPIVAYDMPRTRWIVGDHENFGRFGHEADELPVESTLTLRRARSPAIAAGLRQTGRAIRLAGHRATLSRFFREGRRGRFVTYRGSHLYNGSAGMAAEGAS